MGTCGQPGYVFRDFCLKQGIEFIIFCLNQGTDFSNFFEFSGYLFLDDKAAFIMYPTGGGGGGQRILGGDLKFLEQKKGGYENCLNISGGMLIFCKILSSFCNGFKR